MIPAWFGESISTLPVSAASANTTQPADEGVVLNLPENVELKVLLDYVAQRLGIRVMYDEQIQGKRLTIKCSGRISNEALLGVLDSALRMKGLALADADVPGWKRVVSLNALQASAGGPVTAPTPGIIPAPAPGGSGPAAVPSTRSSAGNTIIVANQASASTSGGGGASGGVKLGSTPVTQVFTLQYADPQKIDPLLRPFLTQPGGNCLSIPDQRVLIVTDLAANLERVGDLIRLLDQPRRDRVVEFVPLANIDVAQAAPQVTQLLAAKYRGSGSPQDAVEVAQESRTNQLVLIGTQEALAEAKLLVASLDVKLNQVTRSYQFKVVAVDRVDRLLRELLGPAESRRSYHAALDKEANLLMVTAPQEVQEQVEALRLSLDSETASAQSPIRFYKLMHTTAKDVIETIRALEGQEGLSQATLDTSDQGVNESPGSTSSSGITPVPQGSLPSESALRSTSEAGPGINTGISSVANPPPALSTSSGGTGGPERPTMSTAAGLNPGVSSPVPLAGIGSPTATTTVNGAVRPMVKTSRATITADTNTNTIIVVAPPAVQGIYERLIKMLDKMRPQVLVECTLVTLDTSGGYSVGVEFSKSGTFSGDNKYLSFSSFGLSEVDKDTGTLTLSPGLGFNGAVISADVGDVVIQALATHGRTRVLSAPKLLVNDNATGTLASIAESPFTSVNASTTVATTSFAGYVSAGTTITVTPHIAEGDHLVLEYAIALNSFTGKGSDGVPPPRQSNTVQSQITVPDNSTVVVGGLNRQDASLTRSSIPIVGDWPVLEWILGQRQVNDIDSTLFVFIRPIILRDDQFEDLKYLSQSDLAAADIHSDDYPASTPMELH